MASALANESGSPFLSLLKLFVPSMRVNVLHSGKQKQHQAEQQPFSWRWSSSVALRLKRCAAQPKQITMLQFPSKSLAGIRSMWAVTGAPPHMRRILSDMT